MDGSKKAAYPSMLCMNEIEWNESRLQFMKLSKEEQDDWNARFLKYNAVKYSKAAIISAKAANNASNNNIWIPEEDPMINDTDADTCELQIQMLEYLSDEDAEKWLQKFHEHNDAKKKPAVIDNEESIHENEDEEEDEDSSGELSFDSAVFHSDCDSDSNSSDSSDASLHTCISMDEKESAEDKMLNADGAADLTYENVYNDADGWDRALKMFEKMSIEAVDNWFDGYDLYLKSISDQ